MAGRRKMDFFVKSPRTEEARKLAQKVFALQKSLGITYQQMSQETGLSVAVLAGLKSSWVNKEVKHKFMFRSCANGLIKFWNLHLINGEKATVGKKAEIRKTPKPAKVVDNNEDILVILIKKVGLSKTIELLKARGKESKLKAFLEKMSPEQLADLV